MGSTQAVPVSVLERTDCAWLGNPGTPLIGVGGAILRGDKGKQLFVATVRLLSARWPEACYHGG